MLLVALAGVLVLLAARGTRRVTVAWLFYALGLTWFASRLAFQPFRNLISIVPFLCVAVAVAVVAGAEAIGHGWRGAQHRRVNDGMVIAMTAVLVAVWTVWGLRPDFQALHSVDSRVLARQYLAERSTPNDTVLVLSELSLTAAA